MFWGKLLVLERLVLLYRQNKRLKFKYSNFFIYSIKVMKKSRLIKLRSPFLIGLRSNLRLILLEACLAQLQELRRYDKLFEDTDFFIKIQSGIRYLMRRSICQCYCGGCSSAQPYFPIGRHFPTHFDMGYIAKDDVWYCEDCFKRRTFLLKNPNFKGDINKELSIEVKKINS